MVLRKLFPSIELTYAVLVKAQNQSQEHHLPNAEVVEAQGFSKSDRVHSLFNKYVATVMVQDKLSETLACRYNYFS